MTIAPTPDNPRVHVVGAGLAGLAAALDLAEAGRPVTLYEAGPQAGGRCRSYFDRELGCRVDNGNHLLLSGNQAAFAYLDQIGARDQMGGPGEPLFPFFDLTTGERWTVRPNEGRVPWWIFAPSRRVPGTYSPDYLALLAFRHPAAEATVAALVREGTLYRRLLEPLAIAALNTPPDQGAATLMAAVFEDTLMRGGEACIPAFPRLGLSESLIDPALDRLRGQGCATHFSRRITALRLEDGRAAGLETSDGPVPLGPGEAVVLAVPPWIAPALLPGLSAPTEHQAIVNLHFAAEPEPHPHVWPAGFIGLIGGLAEWVFVKPGHVSVTISAANRLVDQPPDRLAASVWPEVRTALGLPDGPPGRWRVVKEKRATFAATPAQNRLRPPAHTAWPNVALAGDWTATGLPATIEGAIRSGRKAAGVILSAGMRSG